MGIPFLSLLKSLLYGKQKAALLSCSTASDVQRCGRAEVAGGRFGGRSLCPVLLDGRAEGLLAPIQLWMKVPARLALIVRLKMAAYVAAFYFYFLI